MTEHILSRRRVLGAAAGAAAVPLLGAVPAYASVSETDIVYIGRWGTEDVQAARFDPGAGTLTAIGSVAAVSSSWAVHHPSLPVLYVASGESGGAVHSYRIAGATLTHTSEVATGGTGTAGVVSHIAVDAPSSTLLVANFAAGLAATVPIGRDGTLGEPVSIVQDTGSGPNPRQAGPHPHHVTVDPSGRWLLVADFGADRVFAYPFDRATRQLSASPQAYATPAGSGPRRLAFHRDGRTLYLLNELTADIHILSWEARTGQATLREIVPTDPPGFTGTKSGAELALSDGSRFLYTSNRGENALIGYAVGAAGRLTEIQRIPCGGTVPWSFSIHRGGRWLLVANQTSNTVNLFGIDRRTGLLSATTTALPVTAPDGITFHGR